MAGRVNFDGTIAWQDPSIRLADAVIASPAGGARRVGRTPDRCHWRGADCGHFNFRKANR